MKRRHLLTSLSALAAMQHLPAWPQNKRSASKNDQLTLGIALEPAPGLDPTAGAASSIGEVTLYNIYETLTHIDEDGGVSPLLAESWTFSDDLKTFEFQLRKDAVFSNGEPFNAATAKFSFERAVAENSTNKDKNIFANFEAIQTPDAHRLIIQLKSPDPDLLFELGQATAIMVEPQSADNNGNKPVGTGPYVLDRWMKGSSIRLQARPDWRAADQIAIRQATFRFISEPAAQVTALLSGDVDVFARVAPRGLPQFKNSNKLQTLVGNSRAKTVLAINNARAPLDDVRVRRAIGMALNREAIIAAAADGLGVPIGSYYTPDADGYVDLTALSPHDPEQAIQLLQEAGVQTPLKLDLILPPPAYARQGGEIIGAELAKIGIQTRVQNVEWAQWLANIYGGAHNYDLTIISHVEPLDLDNFAKPDYYWGYHNPEFDALHEKIQATAPGEQRNVYLAQAQTLLAEDAALAWLFQPQWLTVANKNVRGLPQDMPFFTNELSRLSWSP